MVRDLRSHIPGSLKPKHKRKQCCNKFNKDFKKWSITKNLKKKKKCVGDLPSGPVGRTPPFQCSGTSSIPQETKLPHATQRGQGMKNVLKSSGQVCLCTWVEACVRIPKQATIPAMLRIVGTCSLAFVGLEQEQLQKERCSG